MQRKRSPLKIIITDFEDAYDHITDRAIEAAQWRDKYVLKDLFRLRLVGDSQVAFPQGKLRSCFDKLFNPVPPEVRSVAMCLKRLGELWNDRKKVYSVISWHQSIAVRNEAFRLTERLMDVLGKRINAASQEKGAKRKRLINKLNAVIESAIEYAVTSKPGPGHKGRTFLKVPVNTFPYEMVWSSQIEKRKMDGSLLEKIHGVETDAEVEFLMNEHQNDTSIIEVPVACVLIEYVRRLIEKYERLPTKLEARLAIEKDFHELKHVSKETFRDFYKEAGLEGLPAAKPFSHPRNKKVVR